MDELFNELLKIKDSWPQLEDHPLDVYDGKVLPNGTFELHVILPGHGSVGALSGIQAIESSTVSKPHKDGPEIRRMVLSKENINKLISQMDSEEERERKIKQEKYFFELRDHGAHVREIYTKFLQEKKKEEGWLQWMLNKLW
ncbi:hypothetical protein K469DRAFT_695042 [Zopfia rhizophila CBS 207.26]|uniref:Uncharacterized protein n=1 Tax=Zopfia rhizophila CBS 207.26 TaxID=1314779 RepID=A0A6A6DL45_9PEZI|nr:hypothetical protein K469DRAFT_695042 [Zopfia rhizophila CBS 207.26]